MIRNNYIMGILKVESTGVVTGLDVEWEKKRFKSDFNFGARGPERMDFLFLRGKRL